MPAITYSPRRNEIREGLSEPKRDTRVVTAWIWNREKSEQDSQNDYWHLTHDVKLILAAPYTETLMIREPVEQMSQHQIASYYREQLEDHLRRKYPIPYTQSRWEFLFPQRMDNLAGGLIRFRISPIPVPPVVNRGMRALIFSNMDRFAECIKSVGSVKIAVSFFPYLARGEQDKLNDAGLFMRPRRMEIEYNPKRAASQKKIRNVRRKKKKQTDLSIKYWELQSAYRDLKEGLRIGWGYIPFGFNFDPGGRKKKDYIRSILVLVDLHRMFFKNHFYHYSWGIVTLKQKWQKMTNKQRMEFPEDFRNWITFECDYPLKKRGKPYKNKYARDKTLFRFSRLT